MRKVRFVPGEYYHIYNHGVEDRRVFAVEEDFKRALVCLVVFNDIKLSPSKLFRFVQNPFELIKRYTPDRRKRLVDIIALTLLPNHYHLFIREKEKNGISHFMHRFNKGYARYFNLKYGRRGALWEGTFAAKLIDSEAYFFHIMRYVHLNILDLYYPQWRNGKLKRWKQAAIKMRDYSWSSYGYYRDKKDQFHLMDLIINKPDWLSEYYPSPEDFEKSIRDWSLRDINENIADLI